MYFLNYNRDPVILVHCKCGFWFTLTEKHMSPLLLAVKKKIPFSVELHQKG